MHDQLRIKLDAEREAIYQWLVRAYKMPGALAFTIASQHRVDGELIRWVSSGDTGAIRALA